MTHSTLSDTSPVLCIVGPTASGKSDLAQKLAIQLDAEIISADSMQIYKGMDIGTGKIPKQERIVKHYGLDLVPPTTPYSVQLFQDYARSCITQIWERGKLPLLCGGTGFYIRATIDDYRFPSGEQENNFMRQHYQNLASEKGSFHIWSILQSYDPQSASLIHPNNEKRVIRALELHELGKSYAEQIENLKHLKQYLPSFMIGISMPREELYHRINSRVDKMMESGLLDEVKQLIDQGYADGLTSSAAIGYKELIEFLDGKVSLNSAVDSIKKASRHYAKRQLSWFKADKRINWISAKEGSPESLFREALKLYKQYIDRI